MVKAKNDVKYMGNEVVIMCHITFKIHLDFQAFNYIHIGCDYLSSKEDYMLELDRLKPCKILKIHYQNWLY